MWFHAAGCTCSALHSNMQRQLLCNGAGAKSCISNWTDRQGVCTSQPSAQLIDCAQSMPLSKAADRKVALRLALLKTRTAIEGAPTSPLFSGRVSTAACTFLLELPLTTVLRAGLGTEDRAVACCLGVLPTVLAFTAGIKAVASDSGSAFVWYSLL